MFSLKEILTLVKEYNLLTVGPLLIMTFYLVKWDKVVSNLRIEMRAGFRRIDGILEDHDERLDDHEERIRNTERDLLLFGKGDKESETSSPVQ